MTVTQYEAWWSVDRQQGVFAEPETTDALRQDFIFIGGVLLRHCAKHRLTRAHMPGDVDLAAKRGPRGWTLRVRVWLRQLEPGEDAPDLTQWLHDAFVHGLITGMA